MKHILLWGFIAVAVSACGMWGGAPSNYYEPVYMQEPVVVVQPSVRHHRHHVKHHHHKKHHHAKMHHVKHHHKAYQAKPTTVGNTMNNAPAAQQPVEPGMQAQPATTTPTTGNQQY